MNDLTSRAARPAVEELSGLTEDQLFGELGARLKAVQRAPDRRDQFDMIPGRLLESYGTLDELKELGRRFYEKWKGEAEANTSTSRSSVAARDAAAAAIAATLVSSLGVAPALAAVIAVLAVKSVRSFTNRG